MFYYEGEHLTTKLVDFKAYDDDCPVHEKWEVETIRERVGRNMNVGKVLEILDSEFGILSSSTNIVLTDDCFVDYVIRRDDDSHYKVMKPGRSVVSFVEEHKGLRGRPFSNLYQHEWRNIDKNFPYPQLTLAELGIPKDGVLQVETKNGTHYIELSNG